MLPHTKLLFDYAGKRLNTVSLGGMMPRGIEMDSPLTCDVHRLLGHLTGNVGIRTQIRRLESEWWDLDGWKLSSTVLKWEQRTSAMSGSEE